MNLCECGCKEYAKPGKRFIHGHGWKGKRHTEETKKKVSINTKIAMSQLNVKEKHRLGMIGNKNSLGIKLSKEAKEKISASNLGRKRSEETKEKIRKKLIGKKPSFESIEKNRQAHLGKVFSNEHRKNLSIAHSRSNISIKHKECAIRQHQSPNNKFRWPIGESYSEKCFREFLEILGLVKECCFFQEYAVGTYRLDFVLAVNEKIDIEIDGEQHSDLENIEKDKVRDEYLINFGWQIIRISAKSLRVFLKEFYKGKRK